MQEFTLSRKYVAPRGLWAQRREASLNWLALGLLLAAWNSADNDASPTAPPPREASRLLVRLRARGHKSVNVL